MQQHNSSACCIILRPLRERSSEYCIIKHCSIEIKEFPITTKLYGRHIIFSGGGYFRLLPYFLIKEWIQENNEYVLSYIHPRDINAGQPMIKDLSFAHSFKSYAGLLGAG